MFLVQQHKSESRQIESHGFRFMVISGLSDFDLADLAKSDALIFNELDQRDAEQLIAELRRSADKSSYLKPVFKVFEESKNNALGYDGVTDLVAFDGIAARTKSILSKIEHVNTTLIPNDFERQGIFKALAFLYTRDEILEPVPSRSSKIGYAIPFIDQLFAKENALEGLQLLKKSHELGVTTSKLKDRVHNCSSCHSNYINFREVCPKCSSVSIESKDLVHHFKCAHVDVIDKFQVEDGLQCPKCEDKMRHIGIDYDKPSSMYHCHDCHHEFQECDMLAFCIDCEKEDETSSLLENEILTYAITDKGEHIVRNGWSAENNKTKQEGKYLSVDLFRMMLKMEVQRSANQRTSTFGKIIIDDQVLQPLGNDGQELFQQEIITIISSYLAESDLLSSKSSSEYLLLMHDRGLTESEALVDLIEHNLLKLIADNVMSNEDLIINACQEINPAFNPNLVL